MDFFSCTICFLLVCGLQFAEESGGLGFGFCTIMRGVHISFLCCLVICFRCLRCGLLFAFGFQLNLVCFRLLCLLSIALRDCAIFSIYRLCVEEKVTMVGESCIKRRGVALGDQRE